MGEGGVSQLYISSSYQGTPSYPECQPMHPTALSALHNVYIHKLNNPEVCHAVLGWSSTQYVLEFSFTDTSKMREFKHGSLATRGAYFFYLFTFLIRGSVMYQECQYFLKGA